MVLHPTILKDALYNLHPDSGSSPEYARGVLVGAVAAIQANPRCYDWTEAMNIVFPHLPAKIMRGAVPESWTLALGDRIV